MPDEVDLERLPEAAVRVDARGTVVDRNHRAATLLESAPAGAPLEAPGFAAWLAGTGDVFRGRLRGRRANGVPLTLELSARRDRAGRGAVCLLLAPDPGQVAATAQRSFDIAFDTAPIGMALFNTDGDPADADRRAAHPHHRRDRVGSRRRP